MKPLDPRLLRYAKSARFFIIFSAFSGLLIAGLVIAQTILIAAALSPMVERKATFYDITPYIWLLVGVIILRALLIWLKQTQANKAATRSIRQLRQQVLKKASLQNPRWLAMKGADTVTLASRGLSDLGPYFIDYLPQLMLSVTVTPLVLLVITLTDFWSVLVALIAIPLIPIFMILIGRFTQDFSNKRLATMQQLGRQLLDLIAGLVTLKSFGREMGPAQQIQRIGQRYTSTTMATLRVAFLSGAVLEFLSVMSVAMVAVQAGFRLLYGNIDLYTALVIIMLTPEVYTPIREVGKHFHASADGVAAAQAAFDILEDDNTAASQIPHGTRTCPPLAHSQIVVTDLSVSARASWAPYQLNLTIKPAQITALVGPSGAGKTTTMMVLLRQLSPTLGRAAIIPQDDTSSTLDNGIDIADVDSVSLWSQLSWLPQNPPIIPGTVADNIFSDEWDTGRTRDKKALEWAAHVTGFDRVAKELDKGYDTVIGQGGVGLSVGQRQRLALTRALLSDVPAIFMDEPTAHLDATIESHVIAAIKELKKQGKTVVVIAHRHAITQLADTTVQVNTRLMTEEERKHYYSDDIEAAQADDVAIPEFLAELSGGEQ
ncbi:MAG: thiol reductant ABC exporter subunit CydD [Actinomycetaceae bacterium]|nr:thiol reductant ABC exporter subunit CydD [Actinomycetaceae bacterium]